MKSLFIFEDGVLMGAGARDIPLLQLRQKGKDRLSERRRNCVQTEPHHLCRKRVFRGDYIDT